MQPNQVYEASRSFRVFIQLQFQFLCLRANYVRPYLIHKAETVLSQCYDYVQCTSKDIVKILFNIYIIRVALLVENSKYK